MESHHLNAHICRQCGWSYPNHHPSAKQRRAHKKVCGTGTNQLHESQDLVNEEQRGCLVDRQVSSKSVEEEYSDAVTEFTDPDLKASNGNVRMDWIVGSKGIETDGLGKRMVRNESGGSEKLCFYEDSLQVQEECAHTSDIDRSDCYDEKEKRHNILAAVKPASVPLEGLPEGMAEGWQENITGKSSTSPTTESGVRANMEVHNTTSGNADPVFLSCKVDESDNMPHPEDIHQQALVCCVEVPTGQGTGIFGAKDVSRGLESHTVLSDAQGLHSNNHTECSKKFSSVEDVDKTDKLQFVDDKGSLASLHGDRKVDYSIEYALIGNGAETTMVDESMLSVVNTVPCVPNSGGTEGVDSQDCHSEKFVEDSNKCEIMSVGTSVSGTDEAGFVSSDSNIGPLKGERKCDESLEDEVIQDGAESMASAVNTVSYILNCSSNENSAKIVGLGDENSQDCLCENNVESSKRREIRNTENFSVTHEVMFVGATDSNEPLQGEKENEYINEAEGIQIVSKKATSRNLMPLAGIETSVSGTDQVVFSGADNSTKPHLEERGSEHRTYAGVIQNGAEKATVEKLMASAGVETSHSGTEHELFSGAGEPLLGEGEIEYIADAEVVQNGAKHAKSRESLVAVVNSVPYLQNSRAMEERGSEHRTYAGVIQNGAEKATVEKLMASAGVETSHSGTKHELFSGAGDNTKPLLGEGEIEYIADAEVVQSGAKHAKSGESLVAVVNSVPYLQNSRAMEDGEEDCSRISEENEKSVLEKQLKSMALVILNHTGSQFNSAHDDGGFVSVGTVPPSASRMSPSSVVAVETLPGTDSRAQKGEVEVLESVSTLSWEDQQLSNTNIYEVGSSMTLDESSKEKKEHCISEIHAIQNPQQAHASTLKAALDEVLQGRQKNEEIAEKMASRSIRAPLKSFLAEPIFDNRQEATAPGHPELRTYENGATSKAQANSVPTTTGPELSTTKSSKIFTDREWDSPARLPKNTQKKRVRWPPFLCCLHVPSDGANLVGAD